MEFSNIFELGLKVQLSKGTAIQDLGLNFEKGLISEDQMLKCFDILEKGGKKAFIGEKRTFGGREYIKTAQGWKFHGKGTGAKAQEHSKTSTKQHHPDVSNDIIPLRSLKRGSKELKFKIDTIDPDSQEKRYKAGDTVNFVHENKKYSATVTPNQKDDIHELEVTWKAPHKPGDKITNKTKFDSENSGNALSSETVSRLKEQLINSQEDPNYPKTENELLKIPKGSKVPLFSENGKSLGTATIISSFKDVPHSNKLMYEAHGTMEDGSGDLITWEAGKKHFVSGGSQGALDDKEAFEANHHYHKTMFNYDSQIKENPKKASEISEQFRKKFPFYKQAFNEESPVEKNAHARIIENLPADNQLYYEGDNYEEGEDRVVELVKNMGLHTYYVQENYIATVEPLSAETLSKYEEGELSIYEDIDDKNMFLVSDPDGDCDGLNENFKTIAEKQGYRVFENNDNDTYYELGIVKKVKSFKDVLAGRSPAEKMEIKKIMRAIEWGSSDPEIMKDLKAKYTALSGLDWKE